MEGFSNLLTSDLFLVQQPADHFVHDWSITAVEVATISDKVSPPMCWDRVLTPAPLLWLAGRVWDADMDWMCRRTLTGHKDDVTHLSSVTLK